MSLPITKYYSTVLHQYNGNAINWSSDTIKIGLVTSAYTPNLSTDIYWSTPAASEVTGTNYTAGGATITGISVSQTTGVVTVTGNDPDWAASSTGFTGVQYAVLYKSTGTSSTSPLIGYYNIGGSGSNQGGDFIIQFNSAAGSGTIFTAS